MLTEGDVSCVVEQHLYVKRTLGHFMNSYQNKDDWVRAQRQKIHKPIDVDTLIWVRHRLMRLEVEMRWADRICVFEEFFPNDAIKPEF